MTDQQHRADPPPPPPSMTMAEIEALVKRAVAGDATSAVDPYVDAWPANNLKKNRYGEFVATLPNVAKVLLGHPEWAGVLAFNERSGEIEFAGRPPFAAAYSEARDRQSQSMLWASRPVSDADDARIAMWLSEELEIEMRGTEAISRAVTVSAERNAYDPFLAWLDDQEWDGTPRLDTWLIDHLGADDTPLTRAISGKWLISAVARTCRPGCKADHMLVLEGGQGVGKSTALRVLAGDEYFSDALESFSGKDAALGLQGTVIVEVGELAALKRNEVEEIKSFVSREVDRFRPPYGRRTVAVARRCVMAGTTNAYDYLRDDTGGRRFWPVRCGKGAADLEGLRGSRSQIWAEALHRYRAGEPWHLTDQAHIEAAADAVLERHPGDAWEDDVLQYIGTRTSVSSGEIERHLELNASQRNSLSSIRLGGILRRAGFEQRRERQPDGSRPRKWVLLVPVPEPLVPGGGGTRNDELNRRDTPPGTTGPPNTQTYGGGVLPPHSSPAFSRSGRSGDGDDDEIPF